MYGVQLYPKLREALALLIKHQKRAGPDKSKPAPSRLTWGSQSVT